MAEVVFPLFWRTRWDIIAYDHEHAQYLEALRACEGEGNCHGCLQWCDFCGDVGDMCHIVTWPGRCAQHGRYPVQPPPNTDQLQFRFVDVVPARP